MSIRPTTPRRVRGIPRDLREHSIVGQRPMIQVQKLRLDRWGGTVTVSGRTKDPGWAWVTTAWLEKNGAPT